MPKPHECCFDKDSNGYFHATDCLVAFPGGLMRSPPLLVTCDAWYDHSRHGAPAVVHTKSSECVNPRPVPPMDNPDRETQDWE